MVRVMTPGPEFAEGESTMLASVRAEPTPCPPARLEAPTFRSAERSLHRANLVVLAYDALLAAALAAARYSPGRIAVVALGVAAQQGLFQLHAARRRHPRQCVNAGVDRFAWWIVISRSGLFVATVLAAAVTGGVRSPLLVTFIAPYLSAVAIVGERFQTRILLGATAVGTAVLALLPRSVTGPELSAPTYGILLALGVLGLGAVLAPVHALIRKKREEAARTSDEMAADALARAQSLEQIGSKVAHELKNPLTGVKALVQLGLRSPAEAASHGRLEIVEREVTRMQEILQNYLSFTRPLQGMRPRRVALGSLVSDTLVALSARADDARVRLYADGDATLDADPRRLKEALLNLVANAIEATPPGGEVAVEVRPTADSAEITVRDSGRGMPAETLRRIGTPFFTTREEGTGLGVVLARSVITQHGGSLQYESEPGRGTRVRVTLPRAAAGARDGARAARG
jgi:two-component system, NtrC family, sensor histidine kinase HydH